MVCLTFSIICFITIDSSLEKRIEQELLEAEAREFGYFGVYAAMVAEGELYPDDPRYPF